jgi:hypothetical protein
MRRPAGEAAREGHARVRWPCVYGTRVWLTRVCVLGTLSKQGFETIMMNCNPETVSTDYDTSTRLYFEPITGARVCVCVCVCGTIACACVYGTRVRVCFGTRLGASRARSALTPASTAARTALSPAPARVPLCVCFSSHAAHATVPPCRYAHTHTRSLASPPPALLRAAVEDVLNVIEAERPEGIIVQVGACVGVYAPFGTHTRVCVCARLTRARVVSCLAAWGGRRGSARTAHNAPHSHAPPPCLRAAASKSHLPVCGVRRCRLPSPPHPSCSARRRLQPQFGGQTPLKIAMDLDRALKANPIPAASGKGVRVCMAAVGTRVCVCVCMCVCVCVCVW